MVRRSFLRFCNPLASSGFLAVACTVFPLSSSCLVNCRKDQPYSKFILLHSYSVSASFHFHVNMLKGELGQNWWLSWRTSSPIPRLAPTIATWRSSNAALVVILRRGCRACGNCLTKAPRARVEAVKGGMQFTLSKLVFGQTETRFPISIQGTSNLANSDLNCQLCDSNVTYDPVTQIQTARL